MVKELQAISDSLLAVRTRAEDQFNYLRTMSSKSDQELADTEKAAAPNASGGISNFFKKLWPF